MKAICTAKNAITLHRVMNSATDHSLSQLLNGIRKSIQAHMQLLYASRKEYDLRAKAFYDK